MSEDILEQIQGALEQTCGHCHQKIPDDSVSAYYCGPGCQNAYLEARTEQPQDVYSRNDAARYPEGPMRWRPDMVTNDPLPDMTLLEDPPAELRYQRGRDANPYAPRFNAQIYRRTERDAYHFRLDDGSRWVGRDVPDAELMQARTSAEEEARRHWRALERELGNRDHLEPSHAPSWHTEGYAMDVPSSYANDAAALRARYRAFYATGAQVIHPGSPLSFTAAEARRDPEPLLRQAAAEPAGRPMQWARDYSVGEWTGQRMGFRPRYRWCVHCGREHAAPGPLAPPGCTCCHQPLPPMEYLVSLDPTVPGAIRLTVRCEGAQLHARERYMNNAAATFGTMEELLVAEMRQRRGLASRCGDVPMPVGQVMARFTLPLRDTSEALRQMFARLSPRPAEPRPSEHPMEAAIRRRREQQGHTGPQQRGRRSASGCGPCS